MSRQEWYTQDGSYVLLDDGTEITEGGLPTDVLCAVTADQSDMGVRLEKGEMICIARWLLTQALTEVEAEAVVGLLDECPSWDQAQLDKWVP